MAETAKFTPGPWEINEFSDNQGGNPYYRIEGRSTLFLNVVECAYGYIPGQNRANAYLIRSAPDLLAACEFALAALAGFDLESIRLPLREAIAKAKGQEG